jgi:hypothetical protein
VLSDKTVEHAASVPRKKHAGSVLYNIESVPQADATADTAVAHTVFPVCHGCVSRGISLTDHLRNTLLSPHKTFSHLSFDMRGWHITLG